MQILTDVSDTARIPELLRWVDSALPRLKTHAFTEEERTGFTSLGGIDARTDGAEAFRAFANP